MADHRPYNTRRWRQLRRDKLARNPTCEYGFDGCTRAARHVDHKVAIRQGGDPWAWENLASACHRCHTLKTTYVDRMGKAVPVKGADAATGLPRDRNHWWHQ